MWTRVAETLQGAERLLLTTHVNSDGDGIGSELALGRALAAIGKNVAIVNPTATQDRYGFLLQNGEIRLYDPSLDPLILNSDLIVVLDINRWERLGPMSDPVRGSAGRKICIDHHPDPESFGDLDVIVPDASATGVLVHDLLRVLDVPITSEIVDPLYVAILTDTGGFRFPNTNEKTLNVAAELLKRGARPDELYRRVYETSSPGRMRLLGETLSTLCYELDGALVHFSLTNELFERFNVPRDESEGFTDIVRFAQGSQVVLAFVERADGGSKVSLRSKGGSLNVSEIAQLFGGGGHVNASGISDTRPLAELRDAVLDVVRRRMIAGRGS